MPRIDCANIACGFHASDPMTMLRTVRLALRLGKRVGAHPSLPDREGFGRREMKLQPDELTAAFLYQIGARRHPARRGRHAHACQAARHRLRHGGARLRDGTRHRARRPALRRAALRPRRNPSRDGRGRARRSVRGEFFPDLAYGPDGGLLIPRVQSEIDLALVEARMRRRSGTGSSKPRTGRCGRSASRPSACIPTRRTRATSPPSAARDRRTRLKRRQALPPQFRPKTR